MTALKPTNEDTARLMQVISALSSAPEVISAKGRLLDPTNTTRTDLLDLMVAEFDETVLRRFLEFRNELGECLTLEVAERRVMRFSEQERHTSEATGEQIGGILSSKDALAVIDAMQAYCSKSASIHVISRIPTQPPDQDFGGISCAELRRSRRTFPEVSNFPHIVQIAVKELLPHSIAIFVKSENGHEPLEWGPAELVEALRQITTEENLHDQIGDFQMWSGCGEAAQQFCCLGLSSAQIWFVRIGEDWQFCRSLYVNISKKLQQHALAP